MEFAGAILVGGRSSRFGQDKALYPVFAQQKPMVQCVWDSLPCTHKVLVGRPLLNLPYIADQTPDMDVWGGIATALTWSPLPWVAIAGCDQPYLTPEYWQLLVAHAQPSVQAVVCHDRYLEPLGALYNRNVLHSMHAPVSLQQLIKSLNAVKIPLQHVEEHLGIGVLRNINTPNDLI